jgi:hypothetical protein
VGNELLIRVVREDVGEDDVEPEARELRRELVEDPGPHHQLGRGRGRSVREGEATDARLASGRIAAAGVR